MSTKLLKVGKFPVVNFVVLFPAVEIIAGLKTQESLDAMKNSRTSGSQEQLMG